MNNLMVKKGMQDKTVAIEQGIKKIITLLSAAREENASLLAENHKLKETLSQKMEHIRDLEKGIMNKEVASKMIQTIDSERKPEMKLKINELIRDIDKCLNKLNT